MLQKILGDVGIDKRSFSVVSLLLVNAFSWLFFIIGFIEEVIKRTPDINEAAIWSAFYLSIIVFSLIGAVLSKRVRGLKFHYFWIVLGVIASLLSGLVIDFDGIQFVGICALLGASFGLGIPSCLAFFTEVTPIP